MEISVIGAGLAGCEAAWQLVKFGYNVNLYEMKPAKFSAAHKSENFAELVCSNSLKATRIGSAAGMLKEEMRLFGSLILQCAEKCSVGAGGALAVDRELFSKEVTKRINDCDKINVIRKEITKIPKGEVIVATGPLTSDLLFENISGLLGKENLFFYDAASPIITADSIDMKKAFFASRYNKGDADYINCPMNKIEYELFYNQLILGESAHLHNFDKIKVYEGCMPIEVMAKRGKDTMRFGPLKPVGIFHPTTKEKYYAVLQLRKEDSKGTMYNMVGFQTNLKFSEQKRIFSLIPGLSNAEFVRYGVMHRNTFIDSPNLLDDRLRLLNNKKIRFAGQITGVEGYMESAACGIMSGIFLAEELSQKPKLNLPNTTMIGSLLKYINDKNISDFQPMGANMGLLPPLGIKIKNKQERYETLAKRGLDDLKNMLNL
ncbi:MAG: methylenetetrahydrofolate--tRNA-(uracil(54)-C(5))-methyltransferase (FADH(2)-oxidizing) TrmFO [Oscillospiraceae bacterium]|nr:methylenetetrahydrofolate--tRNA-(uracil(54)-C(5))-methyltransferase (FADH(2)-oxidizing) TrmFO [Oscillospiraceae bacterium]